MKTSELIGPALDWAVAKAEGYINENNKKTFDALLMDIDLETWNPSDDWGQGGPIIEREGIFLWRPYGVNGAWSAKLDGWPNERVIHADTALVAAMRCYVASKLGDEVEIPKELM